METKTRCDLVEIARKLRDEGMARTQAADDDRGGWDTKVIDKAIEHLNASRRPWSANDLRELLPHVRQPLIGRRVSSFAGRRLMMKVDREPSTLASTHNHEIAVWVGVDPQAPA